MSTRRLATSPTSARRALARVNLHRGHAKVEVRRIGALHVLRGGELLHEVLPGAIIQLPLIKSLHRELARDRAAARGRAGR